MVDTRPDGITWVEDMGYRHIGTLGIRVVVYYFFFSLVIVLGIGMEGCFFLVPLVPENVFAQLVYILRHGRLLNALLLNALLFTMHLHLASLLRAGLQDAAENSRFY